MLHDLLQTNTQSAVEKPVLKIAFSNNASTAGLASGLAAAAGLIGDSLDLWQRSLVSMKIDVALFPAVDSGYLVIAADSQAPAVSLEDEGVLSVGYGDGSTTEMVMSMLVNGLSHEQNNQTSITRINVVNGGAVLSRLRLNQSYEQQTAGDIVNDLCSQAGVSTQTVEAGIDFPFYVIDDRRSAYEHINKLAKKCGFLSYITTEGKLYFGSLSQSQVVQTFTYSQDIIEFKIHETEAVFNALKVVGSGAVGSDGQDAWSWLIKDPSSVSNEAGEGGRIKLLSDASLRSNSATASAAQAGVARMIAMNLSGHIVVPGTPLVVVGSTIEIVEAPQNKLNDKFIVSRVVHKYSVDHGFISRIYFFKDNANGGSLAGALL